MSYTGTIIEAQARELAQECAARVAAEAEVLALREKVQRQAAHLRTLDDAAHDRNRQLDALRIVWCDGGCETGMARYAGEHPHSGLVLDALVNAARMHRWYVTHRGRELAPQDQYSMRIMETFEKVKAALGRELIDRAATDEATVDRMRGLLERAANWLEPATHIIAEHVPDTDEGDVSEALAVVASIRAELRSPPAEPTLEQEAWSDSCALGDESKLPPQAPAAGEAPTDG